MAIIIFDGDNTIWPCNEYYAQATTNFVNTMVREFPHLDPDGIEQLFEDLDYTATSGPLSFTKGRFPTSMRLTYQMLCEKEGVKVNPLVAEESYLIGRWVLFEAPYLLYDGARELLTRYKDNGHHLILCTKGDYEVQQRKIDNNDAGHLFHHVEIVEKKSPDIYAGTSTKYDLYSKLGGEFYPDETFSVGDSLRDDIDNANAAGIRTVWISERAISWKFEDGYDHVEPEHIIKSVLDLPAVIPMPEMRKKIGV